MNRLQRYAFKLFYIGDRYLGFQTQKNGITIQDRVIRALKKSNIFDSKEDLNFGYSGRTDKYVHSLGQVVAFNTNKEIRIPEINSNLPEDIKFYAFSKAQPNFEPRYHALKRQYKYISFKKDLNISLMKKGAEKFLGIHDFKILSKSPHPKKTIREIYEIEIQRINSSVISIDIIGRSFMREMARRIANILLKIGEQELDVGEVEKYFNPKNRDKIRVRAAPIKNGGELILYNCEYELEFKYIEYSIYIIKKFLWKHIQNCYASLYSNKSLYNYFNQII